eukprot:TRINITY_DN19844_c0_g1_i1.p1 TRINITY_DN19844_c0_g1~~TRINITY_DN19844_c0_g1_i1.p1  ORF type:complete len:292 (+),score=80.05 TRINITY_DN19844_c0_g1_i1:148-1023(+)
MNVLAYGIAFAAVVSFAEVATSASVADAIELRQEIWMVLQSFIAVLVGALLQLALFWRRPSQAAAQTKAQALLWNGCVPSEELLVEGDEEVQTTELALKTPRTARSQEEANVSPQVSPSASTICPSDPDLSDCGGGGEQSHGMPEAEETDRKAAFGALLDGVQIPLTRRRPDDVQEPHLCPRGGDAISSTFDILEAYNVFGVDPGMWTDSEPLTDAGNVSDEDTDEEEWHRSSSSSDRRSSSLLLLSPAAALPEEDAERRCCGPAGSRETDWHSIFEAYGALGAECGTWST